MNSKLSENLQFLKEKRYWMYGPCFDMRFYFQEKRCSRTNFEKVLLSDPMVSTPLGISFPMLDTPGRCVLATGNGEKPLGFIYFGRDRGDYDCYVIATYPLQIKRHYGRFNWKGNAEYSQNVIHLHVELISFIRRLHSQLNFHLAFVCNEDAPGFTSNHSSLNGILIYDWLVQQDDFGTSEFVEYCYALLPFNSVEKCL